ncbi:hypothetical protein [Domibacillus antri]|uniref:hypothetical protein n=1 Tax=Domibacillus antri TaxID=1714264 RepID=UPI0009FB6E43|nr:hypothetical protein [Domibacillus antri]
MSLYNTFKKIDRANKKAVRNAERRRRELIRIQKENQRLAELEAAQLEVEIYENRIEVLKSIHVDSSDPIDWLELSNEAPPFESGTPGPHEKEALNMLQTYKPSLRDKLFGRGDAHKLQLEQDVLEAKKEDQTLYKSWEDRVTWANQILSGNTAVFLDVLEEMNPFEDLFEIGSSIDLKILDANIMEATVYVQSEEVIPQKTKTLTTHGKLSEKNMPKGAYYELYQDYVCGVCLRVARELFALLPINTVYLHAVGDFLNTSTGHNEESAVLSAVMDRETIESFNYSLLDPSDALTHFNHIMNFQKTKGLLPVEPILAISEEGDL